MSILTHSQVFPKSFNAVKIFSALADDFAKAIDRPQLISLILLDYSKALDTVNFELILTKLQYHRACQNYPSSNSCYLQDRMTPNVVLSEN